MALSLTPDSVLPQDGVDGTLVGRAWVPGDPAGPSVVVLRADGLHDISRSFPTTAALLTEPNPAAAAHMAADAVTAFCDLGDCLANTPADRRDPSRPYLLAPIDLQAIKACGVTFVASMLERVIEEQAKGDPAGAERVRDAINDQIGGDLARVKPGSADAERLKQALIERGMWSQYLEVGIGPYAEVFTKSQPMSAVGTGAEVGIHSDSVWNNPEPEVVLAISPSGRIVGATLGNDVNLRDFEGRSALLLGRAKDNNASCAVGPFLRLFDCTFDLDGLRRVELRLKIDGPDGFALEDRSSLAKISRDVADLASQTANHHHQYPDGLVLFTGTMFAPTRDREAPGLGFTHKPGDVVTISALELGTLTNVVRHCADVAPWTFGAGALMANLARRGLL
jgi:fumarylacetoacetate (FAA) hydrolase family protein